MGIIIYNCFGNIERRKKEKHVGKEIIKKKHALLLFSFYRNMYKILNGKIKQVNLCKFIKKHHHVKNSDLLSIQLYIVNIIYIFPF